MKAYCWGFTWTSKEAAWVFSCIISATNGCLRCFRCFGGITTGWAGGTGTHGAGGSRTRVSILPHLFTQDSHEEFSCTSKALSVLTFIFSVNRRVTWLLLYWSTFLLKTFMYLRVNSNWQMWETVSTIWSTWCADTPQTSAYRHKIRQDKLFLVRNLQGTFP